MSQRTRIDLSIFCPEGFFGFAVGYLRRRIEAQVGDKVDLFEGLNPRPELHGFGGFVVLEFIHVSDGGARSYLFEDVELDCIEDARALERVLSQVFDIGVDGPLAGLPSP